MHSLTAVGPILSLLITVCSVPPYWSTGRGDADSDGDVDLFDTARMQSCFGGEWAGPPLPGCGEVEFNGDSNVDAKDWQGLRLNLAGPGKPTATASVGYMAKVMDRFHTATEVYTDADAAGNHFAARGRFASENGGGYVLPMEEAVRESPYDGVDCIRCSFQSSGSNWGGWYFQNGALTGNEAAPTENWGSVPGAGVDMSGATQLTFWAKGAQGGERVEFFAFGVGRHAGTGVPTMPYPDSSSKVSLGYSTLSTDWTQYSLDVGNLNLTYVLGGFGWVTSAAANAGGDITFFLDNIRFDKARLNEPRFLLSYETIASNTDFDVVLRNVAFTYDNALALIGFLASGNRVRATLLADALVYALDNDRFYTDGRVRNAYQAGDLRLPPGWTPNGKIGTVRMPGWYHQTTGQWQEDGGNVGSSTGNVAWAMLALLAYYESVGGETYLNAAVRMGEWLEQHCRDARGSGGYTAGFEGWEPSPAPLPYKSTEHNIDVYAVFRRLHLLTGDDKWRERSEHAKRFVASMWNATDGFFWTGSGTDGVSVNKDVIPVDVQAWAVLALDHENQEYRRALDYAEQYLMFGGGFDFNQDLDGVWYEGTAQMALAYAYTGQCAKAATLLAFLHSRQEPSGAMVAADRDELTTGFFLPDGQPWVYYHRPHVGATAWLVMAERALNPFTPWPE